MIRQGDLVVRRAANGWTIMVPHSSEGGTMEVEELVYEDAPEEAGGPSGGLMRALIAHFPFLLDRGKPSGGPKPEKFDDDGNVLIISCPACGGADPGCLVCAGTGEVDDLDEARELMEKLADMLDQSHTMDGTPAGE